MGENLNHKDKDILLDEFQYLVDDLFVRNKSLIDAITKFQESNARVNRNISKSITQCGCIKLNASKQNFNGNDSLEDSKSALNSHVKGSLCDDCRDMIEKEIGRNFFYLTVICNDLGINIYDVILKE
jgi:hypothetical protein